MKNDCFKGFGLRIFFSCLCLLFSVSSCTAQWRQRGFPQDDSYLPVTKQKVKMPPKIVLKKIAKSDRVMAYTVDALSEDTLNEKLCGFSTVGKPKELTVSEADFLRSLVAEESSFVKKDDVVKYSAFIPDYAFKFMREKDSVVVFLDFHADMWSFEYQKKRTIFDNAVVSKKLRSFVKSVFNLKSSSANAAKTVAANSMQPSNGPEESVEKPELKETVAKVEKRDTVKYRTIPTEMEAVIKNADSIYCCLLDPLAEEVEEKKLGKFLILQEKEVKEKDASALAQRLLCKKSFPEMPYLKNCTFLPDLAFIFVHKGERLNVMFSFYCNECKMVLNDKLEFHNDCSDIQSEIVKIGRKIFPKDKYLRTISK